MKAPSPANIPSEISQWGITIMVCPNEPPQLAVKSMNLGAGAATKSLRGRSNAPLVEAILMFRTIILGLATVATIAAMTVAVAVIGTAAATYAIDRATLAATAPTATAATPQWPARYVGRFVGLT